MYIIETEDEEMIRKLLKLKGRKKLTIEIDDSRLYAAIMRHYGKKIKALKIEKNF